MPITGWSWLDQSDSRLDQPIRKEKRIRKKKSKMVKAKKKLPYWGKFGGLINTSWK